MNTVATTCGKAASIFALLTLPSDQQCTVKPTSHPDFAGASGYLRRQVGGVVVHAVDWDGRPGVESVFREDGPKSHALWKEWRAFRQLHPESSLEICGTRVCELLLHYFGPYDELTAHVLASRRKLELRRIEIAKALHEACPEDVRDAAHEYLLEAFKCSAMGQPLTRRVVTGGEEQSNQMPVVGGLPLGLLGVTETSFSASGFARLELLAPHREHSTVPYKSLEMIAQEVIDRARPFEAALEEIDVALSGMRLPEIPGEGYPAHINVIPHGRLICRHRAVIAVLPLAEAGFDVELVNGSREVGGVSVPHLFIYSREVGVLEPSANGPEFWIKVKHESSEPKLPVLEMQDGSRYHFAHRTKIRF